MQAFRYPAPFDHFKGTLFIAYTLHCELHCYSIASYSRFISWASQGA